MGLSNNDSSGNVPAEPPGDSAYIDDSHGLRHDMEALVETVGRPEHLFPWWIAYLRARGPPPPRGARRTGCSMKGLDSCISRVQVRTTARMMVGRPDVNIKRYNGGRGGGQEEGGGIGGWVTGGDRESSGDNCRCCGYIFFVFIGQHAGPTRGKEPSAQTRRVRTSDFAYLEVWGELE